MEIKENKNRQIVKIIKEICKENGINYHGYSSEWILELTANNKTMYIYGYKFPQNNAATSYICDDKAAVSDILEKHCIPHITHFFFMSPKNMHYIGDKGNWHTLTNLLKKYGELICKSNTGTGGNCVYRVRNQKDLEEAVMEIFSKSRSMAVSPYVNVNAEFRVVVSNSTVEIMYEKKRPYVVGNGRDTIAILIANSGLSGIEYDETIDLSYVPADEEIITVSWKHNLGQGATPVIVKDENLKKQLSKLALQCAEVLNVDFASVDIIEDENGLNVLEVNSGIMMESFASSSEKNYQLSKKVYEKAVCDFFYKQKKCKLHQKPIRSHVLPIIHEIAKERGVKTIEDTVSGKHMILDFGNNRKYVLTDDPFNINDSASVKICKNKSVCTYFLNAMGFSVPKEKYFVIKNDINLSFREYKQCLENPEENLGFNFPLIVKPNDLSQGIGVNRIDSYQEGLNAFFEMINLQTDVFLVQKYYAGKDYRIVVLNGKVIQAYERTPFQVVGNGFDSIEKLIRNKVQQMSARDKKIDLKDYRIYRCLSKQGYTMDEILEKGTICRLQDVSNLSLGGTVVDKLDEVTAFYKNLAIEIAKALNLKLCGIDIIAEDITDEKNREYRILEVNSAPGLDNYLHEGSSQATYVLNLYRDVFDYLQNG